MIKAILFPGQGSQFKGMGKDLFKIYPEITLKASELLGYDLEALCVDDAENLLGKTQYTQPAIYTVSAMHYWEYLRENEAPEFLAGHSLGEYNALLAAGAFDFETGLKLVQKRGALMGAASGGGMAAVLGIDAVELRKQLDDGDFDAIDVANFNTPNQTVITGQQKDIDAVVNYFDEIKTRAVPLQVSAPFHSRYMKSAAVEFVEFIKDYQFNELKIPVIANVTANWYGTDIHTNLSNQIDGSVQWVDSIRLLMGQNITEFKEIGSAILTKMVKEIQSKCEPLKTAEATPNTVIEKKIFLGSKAFCKDYNIKYPYVAGAMYRGVASPKMIVKLGKARMLGYYGTGGLSLTEIEKGIHYIKSELNKGESFGMNLLHHFGDQELEMKTVDLYLQEGIQFVEASAFMQMTKALVYYRIKGLRKDANGHVYGINRIMAKISRPEVAEVFMDDAPERLVNQLLQEGKISSEEADLAQGIPMSYDICVEADSGGHTDSGIAMVILPAIQQLREEIQQKSGLKQLTRVGLAGGIGTPQSIVCAFMMGADFVLTGSINQCTVEAGTSDVVKDLLQEMNVQDTDYAPAGDMFEMGAKVQVLKKGVLFSPRANKLYALYNQYESLDAIPEKTRNQLEKTYFKRPLSEIWEEAKKYHKQKGNYAAIEKAENDGKLKMGMVFKWYFGFSSSIALNGEIARKVNFQVHTGPSLGAFNQWVKGTPLESWRARHVDVIGEKLMTAATQVYQERVKQINSN